MRPNELIDNLMRQTTVLIAQISTSVGLRSQLAHIADQVFLSLSKELEDQGLSKKVAADMFGLALRSYQRKVARVADGARSTDPATVWESVLRLCHDDGPQARDQILARFARDEHHGRVVVGVLNDLVTSGVLYQTGRGPHSVYGVVPDTARRLLKRSEHEDSVKKSVWYAVYDKGGRCAEELQDALGIEAPVLERTLGVLCDEGLARRIDSDDHSTYSATSFVIRPGEEEGWEIAVFDHFQAVTQAIAAKLDHKGRDDEDGKVVGGSTLRFRIWKGHPLESKILRLLEDVRSQLDALWESAKTIGESGAQPDREVIFYFGQNTRESEND